MAPTVHIVDPGFRGGVGHHRPVDELLGRRALAHGMKVRVLGHETAELVDWQDMELVRAFPHPEPYATFNHPSAFLMEAPNIYMTAKQALTNYVAPYLQPGDIVVTHTVGFRFLPALLAWAQELDVRPVAIRVVLFQPLTNRHDRHLRSYAHSLAAAAVAQHPPASGVSVAYFSDTAPLARELSTILERPVEPLPQGFDFSRAPVPGPAPTEPIVLGQLGRPRPEKGSDLVDAGMPDMFRRWGQLHVLLQTDPKLAAGKALCRDWPERVIALQGPLGLERFYDAIARCSAVLLPYWPKPYTLRSSHILIESLALARPVLVPDGSWLAEMVRSFDPTPGTIMPSYDMSGFCQAATELVERLPALQEAAHRAAPVVRARHDPDSWADRLLQAPSQGPG